MIGCIRFEVQKYSKSSNIGLTDIKRQAPLMIKKNIASVIILYTSYVLTEAVDSMKTNDNNLNSITLF